MHLLILGPLGSIGHFVLTPLYYAVSGVMLAWHSTLSLVLDPNGGMSWALSIIGLTLVIRAALIPLFVKQIKSSRNMQLIQPRVKELQKKYGHDREKLAAETMALYKETGTNPFASCLPILLQMPIFLALFRLIDHAAKKHQGNGFLSSKVATQFADSKIFGALPVKASFTHPDGVLGVQIVAAVLVLAMTATTFTTQRQLMSKNMPADAMTGQYAQQQKMLLYVLPVVFAVGGIAFPIGVLLYWTTSNLWTMGQQFYVIRNNPAPGTPAFKAKEERDARKKAKVGTTGDPSGVLSDPATERIGTMGTTTGSPASPSAQGTASDAERRPSAATTTQATVEEPATERGHRSARWRQPGQPEQEWEQEVSDEMTVPDEIVEAAGPDEVGGASEASEASMPAGTGEASGEASAEDDTDGDGVDGDSTGSAADHLEHEGDIAADYLEELLDIADLDGDLDMDVEGDRAAVSIIGAELSQLVGSDGRVLEALQELTRLAVYRETGERSRLMLDISGYRAGKRAELEALAEGTVAQVRESGERASLHPMTPFERKVVHDAVAAAGLSSESEGVEPRRFVVVLPR